MLYEVLKASAAPELGQPLYADMNIATPLCDYNIYESIFFNGQSIFSRSLVQSQQPNCQSTQGRHIPNKAGT